MPVLALSMLALSDFTHIATTTTTATASAYIYSHFGNGDFAHVLATVTSSLHPLPTSTSTATVPIMGPAVANPYIAPWFWIVMGVILGVPSIAMMMCCCFCGKGSVRAFWTPIQFWTCEEIGHACGIVCNACFGALCAGCGGCVGCCDCDCDDPY
jgi:hypothetical protein